MVPREEWLATVARSRAFVNASRWEDYGIAQFEALAAGTPVVSVPSPGQFEALPLLRELAPDAGDRRRLDADAAGRGAARQRSGGTTPSARRLRARARGGCSTPYRADALRATVGRATCCRRSGSSRARPRGCWSPTTATASPAARSARSTSSSLRSSGPASRTRRCSATRAATSSAHAARSMLRGGDDPDEVARAVARPGRDRRPLPQHAPAVRPPRARRPRARPARGPCCTCTTTACSARSRSRSATATTASAAAAGDTLPGLRAELPRVAARVGGLHDRARAAPAARVRRGRRVRHAQPLRRRAARPTSGCPPTGCTSSPTTCPDDEIAERVARARGRVRAARRAAVGREGRRLRDRRRARVRRAAEDRGRRPARGRAARAGGGRASRVPRPRARPSACASCCAAPRWRSSRASRAT